MSLPDLIYRGSRDGSRKAILERDEGFAYKELFRRMAATSGFLRKGYKRGDRIGILSENGIGFISAYLGCMHAGMVAVPVNTASHSSDMEFIAGDCGLSALLASERLYGRAQFREKLRIVETQEMDHAMVPSGVPSSELASLMYTSGSTGKPNAVMVTHRNLIANTNSIVEYLGLVPEDRCMAVLPFYYCYGASLMHTTLATGGSLVINNRFMFPQRVVEDLAKQECTIFAGVPSTYKILMSRSRLGEADTSSLRYALQAGGRLPPGDIARLRGLLPHTQVIVMYGQTEATSRLSWLPPGFLNSKAGSIGKGIPGVELMVVDGQGREARPGETGEIIARGENVSPGYWNRPEENSKTFRQGWLHTGDMATRDEEGFIYVVGRSRDFVKVAGNRFSAVEVEDVISSVEGVEMAAVVGVPDEMLGESLEAYVVGRGIGEQDIMDACRRALPSFKVPGRVRLVNELPLNSFGKVQKFRLLESIEVNA